VGTERPQRVKLTKLRVAWFRVQITNLSTRNLESWRIT